MTSPKSSKKTSKSATETVNNTDPMESLEAKLKAAHPEIQQYVAALTAENQNLLRKYLKCEAEKVTLQNRIVILEQNLDEAKRQENTTAIVELLETLRKQRDKR